MVFALDEVSRFASRILYLTPLRVGSTLFLSFFPPQKFSPFVTHSIPRPGIGGVITMKPFFTVLLTQILPLLCRRSITHPSFLSGGLPLLHGSLSLFSSFPRVQSSFCRTTQTPLDLDVFTFLKYRKKAPCSSQSAFTLVGMPPS